MDKRKRYLILATIMVLSLCSGPGEAKNPAIQKGIDAYNAKNFSQALSYLESASQNAPKDEAVHYYLGLTYQALNRTSDAEREYNWNYRNGKVADLKYKSWQALVSLSRRQKRSISANASRTEAPVAQPVPVSRIAVKAGGSPYKPEQGKAPTSESGFTAGCFKH